ncbi:MAG: hypothetical protein A3F17_00730 [Gammaproteobacteria bacterium RIFCSPHIGHO2_12_FULL_41_15]|nr:MAG: hypothetical protein A3F17_00730 [Gammaproteobacteria bacterium RIFCSPHIGHO2_12_FULL_41_15]
MKSKMNLVCLVSLFAAAMGMASTPTPVGTWRTVDPKTGLTTSYIKMIENDHILTGNVVKIFEVSGQKVTDICHHCPNGKDGQRVLGLGIIWDMHCQGSVCKKGRILDPRDGDVYHAQLSVADDNKTMHLRGYILLPLFGRTQDWYRVA